MVITFVIKQLNAKSAKVSIVFQVQFLGCPGKPKISIPYSVWVEDLIIYIYIHVVMSWDVLSVGGSPQLIDNCVIV